MSVYTYIIAMAVVTYLIRAVPLVLFRKKDRESVFKFVFILCAICLPNGTYPSGDFLQYGKCYQCDRRICRSGYPWYP